MRYSTSVILLLVATPSGAAAQPVWDDLVPGVWTVVSSNTIDDVDPCPAQDCSYSAVEGISGVIDDWCGGAFASGYGTLGGLVAWGGGHNGYFGSEVYVFDLVAGTWARASEPYSTTSGSVAADCSDDGVYPDGSACPTHTYDQIDYHPGTNRLVIIGGTPDPVCGGCVDDRIHFFDFDTGTWALGARKSTSLYYGGTTAYDASRDLYWLLSGYVHTFSSYDPNADAWSEHGTPNPGNNGIDGAGVVDPVRDLYIYVDALETGRLYAMPLAGPFDVWTELSATGDMEVQSAAKLGLEWEPLSERLVAWDDGADVYVLNPPAGDPLSGTWVWARVPPDPSNTVVPRRNMNGTYSRFRYAASVNAFLLVSSTGGPVWAYRLTPGSGTGPMPRPDGGPVIHGEPNDYWDGGTGARGDDGGCGCRTSARADNAIDGPLWIAGVLVGVAWRRRRRRTLGQPRARKRAVCRRSISSVFGSSTTP